MTKNISPDFLFETSWEVCNKVGGIHTVLSTRALTLVNELKNNCIFIGPDVWRDETRKNPEFQDDPNLFHQWKIQAESEGLHVRIGRWKVRGNPVAIIVDFQSFLPQKDEIFSQFWETYKLDSLTGQWDYIEPALFGYAAGKVIESFCRFNAEASDRIVAQFHEWMTGTGLLYLKKNSPHIATIFTTHATVLGRCIAGNNLPLYNNMESFNPEEKAAEFNVKAKHSLETISARYADTFTTVSDITARECSHFLHKDVDIVTPNGFEDSFVPDDSQFEASRTRARVRLKEVAKALFGTLSENPLFIANSGRYEFKNKGIDVFIKTMGALNRNGNLDRELVAVLFIPANHYGARRKLLSSLEGEVNDSGKVLTHNLHDYEYDPILKLIEKEGLTNAPGDKVKIMFVPCYLDGNDGVFNLSYYDLLIGMDLTVFPSYYEPWGYTPMESVAFHVPTITTTLAGFGKWVLDHDALYEKSVSVVERSDADDQAVVGLLEKEVLRFVSMDEESWQKTREGAFKVSRIALWQNFIQYYYKAYETALETVKDIPYSISEKDYQDHSYNTANRNAEMTPKWRNLLVESSMPDGLAALQELSRNLWWCWNYEASDLFESIDPKLWLKVEKNPILLLEQLSYQRLSELEKDPDFMSRLNAVYAKFTSYMEEKSKAKGPKIAYFSMEYGLHSSLRIYSGGLGILAGDYLKEASDMNVDMVGVGLLYRYGYFRQVISSAGDQINQYDPQDFAKIPVRPVLNDDGSWKAVHIVIPGRTLHARIWEVKVGRISLYLLDTDYEDNDPQDRFITHQLYGGGEENRIKQEILLGIGGIRALRSMGIHADIYHCNEGHAAFLAIERLSEYISHERISFAEAKEVVRASTLFTTHTPVPAGHDAFEEGMIRMYLSHYPDLLSISWRQFMTLGRIDADNQSERFSMSFLAANLSQGVNGVSWLHGKVSQKIFAGMWPGYLPEELNIGYVTNGVHYPTWAAKSWQKLYESKFGEGFLNNQTEFERWNNIYDVPDEDIWNRRTQQRNKLYELIDSRIAKGIRVVHDNPKYLLAVKDRLNPKALTIGFARRFATYKRAHLLFKDLDRLSRILNNPEMPVQFVFAGKAHPADKAGQDLIKMIVNVSKRPEFIGKIIFLDNYDMDLASTMVQGVDIWMNTPTRPLEASGTSGEKAVMNGVLHFSVLDGWWYEGYKKDAGWELSAEITFQDNNLQDELDAEIIYSRFENEIIPAFYDRGSDLIPHRWVAFIKNSIAKVASQFTTSRMMRDYFDRFYLPQAERTAEMKENDFELAKEISRWKRRVLRRWDDVKALDIRMTDPTALKGVSHTGNQYSVDIELDTAGLSPEEIGVECITVDKQSDNDSYQKIVSLEEFTVVSVDSEKTLYRGAIKTDNAGVYEYGFRIFPKNQSLPHRQDFPLNKWL